MLAISLEHFQQRAQAETLGRQGQVHGHQLIHALFEVANLLDTEGLVINQFAVHATAVAEIDPQGVIGKKIFGGDGHHK